jgi:signal transduction histidine kinase
VLRESGIDASMCADVDSLCADIGRGAGAVLVADEGVLDDGWRGLAAVVARQPRWSDLPVLVLTRPGPEAATDGGSARESGNVTLLERPVRVAMLVSAVRVALRARDRAVPDPRAPRAAAARRGGAAGSGSAQGRVPGDARTRAAQSAGADSQRRRRASLTDTGDPALERVRDIMRRQVNHMVRLVDDLLEISRITRGKIELRKQRIDLSAVIASAIETSRPLIESAGHVLHVTCPTGRCCSTPIRCASRRCFQIS